MAEDKALSFLRLIRRSQRGKLKVYLGYGAGVGKTWQMLKEGHRLKNEGVDVVVGLVETHGRAETAELIEGLELVPRRQVQYRGITLEEMDLEAVLARRPEVALVDELAHTNVREARIPNAIRTWRTSWRRASTSSAPSTFSISKASMTSWKPTSG